MRKLVWIVPVLLLSGCGSDNKSNSAPVFTDAGFTTQTETALMNKLMASDPDSDLLSFSLDSAPTHGAVSINSNGDFVYQPKPEFTGNDSFVARATDGQLTVSAKVSIVVNRATVSFLQYSKAAFAQQETDAALRVNARDFTQDSTTTADYAEVFQ